MADEVRRGGDYPLWDLLHWTERFGVAAGVTGRATAAGDRVDLGLAGNTPVGEAMEQWRRFRSQHQHFPSQVLGFQVHHSRVARHEGAPGWSLHDGTDGHVTRAAGTLLLVTVADCVPVYLIAPRQRGLALLHAGWRGTAAGILAAGVRALSEASGSAPSEMVMHCGIAISGPCYEVGREVMDGVGKPAPGSGPWHLDLRSVLAEQGKRLGIGEVTVSGHCTAREAVHFHSHRRSGGTDGRMVAWLGYPST